MASDGPELDLYADDIGDELTQVCLGKFSLFTKFIATIE